MTKTTQYLYNINAAELKHMIYYDALEFKLKNAKELQRKLIKREIDSEDDRVRLFYVEKAIRHTRRLIDEQNNI